MFSHKFLFIITLTLVALFSSSLVALAAPDVPVVSYIRTWPIGSTEADMDLGQRWTADDIQGDLLSIINVAFGLLDGNLIYIKDMVDLPGETDPNITIPAFTNLFAELAEVKARYPHVKVNLSVGGWGAEGFSDMALTAKNRAEFVADVEDWIRKYDLDGVDIDWEYPVRPEWGQEIKSRPEDAENYILLLTDLRVALDKLGEELGKHLAVTTAVPASGWFPGVIDVLRLQEQVDYLKLMSYDYYGGWSGTTGHAANLYNNPEDPEWGGWSTDQAVNLYLNAGVTPSKLLMGVPFYARAWRGVGPENNGLFQPYESSAYDHGLNFMDIKNHFLTDPSYVRYWDDVAKAPYLYNGDEFITYEDEESLAYKVAYIREKGLSGIMIWEYGHDLNAELLRSLNDSIEATK